MGADFIDYVIADETVLPFQAAALLHRADRSPSDCYQVNDSKRTIAAHTPARKDVGLRDDAFVFFCCFNNNHKITAPVFDVWMRILRQIERR
jgi:predicted O-linked N-acetylglucosamine transferase (SPINDLY family)